MTKPEVILTSPFGSLASDLFWPEIWGDIVKISHGKQRTEREHVVIFFRIWNSAAQLALKFQFGLYFRNHFCFKCCCFFWKNAGRLNVDGLENRGK